jgi:hypothetical protein
MSSWRTERVWVQPKNKSSRVEVAVTPDSYFALDTPRGRGHFFIELDRGTETIYRAWQQKILAYKEYWRGGKFRQRYCADDGAASFRVLAVTPSQKRTANIIAAAQQHGSPEAAGLFLSAPISRIDRQVLNAPIWARGGVAGAQALL